jgi:hypothetical protein
MSDAAFLAKWEGWLNENKLFESKPGVFVKIGTGIDDGINDRRTFKQMIMGGFIFEVKPGHYRIRGSR